ncbi:MAG: MerR family regulatory protein [Cyanobacteria bacterium RYN_339]|nr:MerR family regulatory protein [Cyanobacteria bacterium RYN_339]
MAPSTVIMMDEPTTAQPNEHWSTSEVAKDLGVSPSLVRTWIAYMNWEVRRSADGHRIFSVADVEQLKSLKAWLDEGHTLKEYRRERQGDGPFDPRIELRAGYRHLRELQSQEEALLDKHRDIMDSFQVQRKALQDQLEAIRTSLGPEDQADEPFAAGAPPAPADVSSVVQGVLKQLLTSLLEKQGKLQLVRRFEEDGRPRLEYLAPTGKRQVVEDLCAADEDRRMLETVLRLISHG